MSGAFAFTGIRSGGSCCGPGSRPCRAQPLSVSPPLPLRPGQLPWSHASASCLPRADGPLGSWGDVRRRGHGGLAAGPLYGKGLSRSTQPVERGLYRLVGVSETDDQPWIGYLLSVLEITAVGPGVSYLLLCLQDHLPLNPQGLSVPGADLASIPPSASTTSSSPSPCGWEGLAWCCRWSPWLAWWQPRGACRRERGRSPLPPPCLASCWWASSSSSELLRSSRLPGPGSNPRAAAPGRWPSLPLRAGGDHFRARPWRRS